jgi:hypothetical protein
VEWRLAWADFVLAAETAGVLAFVAPGALADHMVTLSTSILFNAHGTPP